MRYTASKGIVLGPFEHIRKEIKQANYSYIIPVVAVALIVLWLLLLGISVRLTQHPFTFPNNLSAISRHFKASEGSDDKTASSGKSNGSNSGPGLTVRSSNGTNGFGSNGNVQAGAGGAGINTSAAGTTAGSGGGGMQTPSAGSWVTPGLGGNSSTGNGGYGGGSGTTGAGSGSSGSTGSTPGNPTQCICRVIATLPATATGGVAVPTTPIAPAEPTVPVVNSQLLTQ